MAEIDSILVNDKTYKVQGLSVLDTIDLHIDAIESFGEPLGKLALLIGDIKTGKVPTNDDFCSIFKGINAEKIKPFKKRILAQVITPTNQFLGDDVTIEQWFSKPENMDDVWEVLVKATEKLLGKYLPNFLREIASQMLVKATAKQSKSQENTENKQ